MEKKYKVRISFGDGNPIEDTFIAKSGVLAQDMAMRAHPGARNVHLIGIDNRYEGQKPVPVPAPRMPMQHKEETSNFLFTDSGELPKDRQIECCVQLRRQGKSHNAIAGYLGVSKTTVGRWLKQYG